MDLTRTPREAVGVLLESHLPGARIYKGSEKSLNTTKIRTNRTNWHMARKVVTEGRMKCVVNTFMPYKAPGPDGIYPICL